MAEAVFLDRIKQNGVTSEWIVDSAATADYHVGSRPDKRALEVLQKNGIENYNHVVRQINDDDFEKFDVIFGMDEQNIADLKELSAQASKKKKVKAEIKLLATFDSDGDKIIKDPYYTKGLSAFELVYEKCVRSCNGLLAAQK